MRFPRVYYKYDERAEEYFKAQIEGYVITIKHCQQLIKKWEAEQADAKKTGVVLRETWINSDDVKKVGDTGTWDMEIVKIEFPAGDEDALFEE